MKFKTELTNTTWPPKATNIFFQEFSLLSTIVSQVDTFQLHILINIICISINKS